MDRKPWKLKQNGYRSSKPRLHLAVIGRWTRIWIVFFAGGALPKRSDTSSEGDERDDLVVVLSANGDGDAPEGEIVCIDVAEVVGLLDLDEVFEVTNCLSGHNLDRECIGRGLPIDKTEQGMVDVGHGAAKHEKKRKIEERWRM